MVRIKDIPNFYERLHAIEKLYTEQPTTLDYEPRLRYGLKDTSVNDPALVELRIELGLPIKNGGPRHEYIENSKIDWDSIFKRMSQLRMYRKDLAAKLGINKVTWSRKFYDSTFTEIEVKRMEKILNFKEGKIYPVDK